MSWWRSVRPLVPRGTIFGLLLLGACGGTEHPEMHFDVRVTSSSVYVYATEVGRPDATSQEPFAHPGECDETSDGWGCDGACPGEWLGQLRLVSGGETIAEGVYDWPWGGGVGQVDTVGLADALLVIEDLDGAEVDVPIPDVPRPVPIIDDATRTEIGPTRDEIAITWHTDPDAASAVVEVNGGFGGPRCHLASASDVTAMEIGAGGSLTTAIVTAFASPATVETSFGVAEVWVGDVTSLELP